VPDGQPWLFWNQQAHERSFVTRDGGDAERELVSEDLIGDLYLGHGPGGDLDDEAHDIAAREHAARMVGLLRGAGFTVEHDGDPGTTIVVKAERSADTDERRIMEGLVQCEDCGSWEAEESFEDGLCWACADEEE
jgi:hypothetical protein